MGSEIGQHKRSYENRYNDVERPADPEWRKAEDELSVKLKEVAKLNYQKAHQEKDNTQTVRLWLNQITPDNYEKKQSELRGLMFGDRLAKDEPGFEN